MPGELCTGALAPLWVQTPQERSRCLKCAVHMQLRVSQNDEPARQAPHVRVQVLQGAGVVDDIDDITRTIIGSAIEVHRVVGPGVLESAYELAMCVELQARGVAYLRQVRCPIVYRGHCIGDYRLDLMVADTVAVEIKSVDAIRPVHVAQMLTYLRASRKQTGLIINFNEPYLKNGIRRVVLRSPQHPGGTADRADVNSTSVVARERSDVENPGVDG